MLIPKTYDNPGLTNDSAAEYEVASGGTVYVGPVAVGEV